jgi:hypothetical protein
VWPPALLRPSPPPELVYLDMNHWIHLAQAATGHPNGAAHLEALETCKAARAFTTALFPLAAAHCFEMAKIKEGMRARLDEDPRWRRGRIYEITPDLHHISQCHPVRRLRQLGHSFVYFSRGVFIASWGARTPPTSAASSPRPSTALSLPDIAPVPRQSSRTRTPHTATAHTGA